MQIDVDRVSLIAGGLLEVHAVRGDLPPALGEENARAQFAPSWRIREFATQHACVEEAERFAREVRVW